MGFGARRCWTALRAVAVLGLLAGGSLLVPATAGATTPLVANLTLSPNPVAAPGTLRAKQVVTVTITATDSAGAPIPAAPLLVWFARTGGGGSAVTHAQPLGVSPLLVRADAAGQVRVLYHAPSYPQPTSGSDTIVADSDTCCPQVTGSDSYTFAPGPPKPSKIASFVARPEPFGRPGRLPPLTRVAVTITARDASGAPVAGATVYLAFRQAPLGGVITCHGLFVGSALSSFKTDPHGQIALTYLTPARPPGSGTDTLTVINMATSPTASGSDGYTFSSHHQ